jgi:hypothetical protein
MYAYINNIQLICKVCLPPIGVAIIGAINHSTEKVRRNMSKKGICAVGHTKDLSSEGE